MASLITFQARKYKDLCFAAHVYAGKQDAGIHGIDLPPPPAHAARHMEKREIATG